LGCRAGFFYPVTLLEHLAGIAFICVVVVMSGNGCLFYGVQPDDDTGFFKILALNNMATSKNYKWICFNGILFKTGQAKTEENQINNSNHWFSGKTEYKKRAYALFYKLSGIY
jgi:hypothetical protein